MWFMFFMIVQVLPGNVQHASNFELLLDQGFAVKADCESAATTRHMELMRHSPLAPYEKGRERRYVCIYIEVAPQ